MSVACFVRPAEDATDICRFVYNLYDEMCAFVRGQGILKITVIENFRIREKLRLPSFPPRFFWMPPHPRRIGLHAPHASLLMTSSVSLFNSSK